jgi:HK97 family phage prohead protease
MTIEYRYARDAKPGIVDGKLSGRAIVYNKSTQIGPDSYGFRETIAPGAVKKSIGERDVVLLDSHDQAKPLARVSAKNLSLRDGKDGLDWDANPPNTSYANDVQENARAGNYGGCSFGFEVVRDSWKKGSGPGALDERTIHEVKLHEISICAFPAYSATSVQARDAVKAAQESRERALGPNSLFDSEGEEDRGGEYGDNSDAAEGDSRGEASDGTEVSGGTVSLAEVGTDNSAPMEANVDIRGELLLILANCELTVDERINNAISHIGRSFTIPEKRADEDRDIPAQTKQTKQDNKDPQDKAAEDNGKDKSDASKDGGKQKDGKQACANCEDGKDKSGNQCPACGGSGFKNGNGKNKEKGTDGNDDSGKGKPVSKNSADTSDVETRSGENDEPGEPTRTDDERRDALRMMRAKMTRDSMSR